MYFVCLTVSGDLYFTSFTSILYSELLQKVFVTFGLSFIVSCLWR